MATWRQLLENEGKLLDCEDVRHNMRAVVIDEVHLTVIASIYLLICEVHVHCS